jgi:tetratricopeptide (TPR) repeat protein
MVGTFDKAYYSQWIDRGTGHAARALELDPKDPDALELRGSLDYWRWLLNLEPDQTKAAKLLASSEQDLRSAVEANPKAASAWALLSHLLMGQSQTAEAKLAALRAYEADPYLTSAKQTVWRLFQASLDLEDRVEATHWCEEGQGRFPQYYRFTECQIWLFALKGVLPDVPKAWRLLDEYQRQSPPNQRASQRLYGQMLVALALARAGLGDSARAVALRSRGDATTDPTHDQALIESLVRMLLGDKDEALRLLSTYIATNPQFRGSLARDQSWWFQSLRDDPRFKALVGT